MTGRIIYHLFPLGAMGGSSAPSVWAAWGEYLQQLGVNTVLLGPVLTSMSHGYDIVDYYHLDPRLGDNAMFERVAKDLKAKGLDILLDAVFHHVGRDFFAFQDVLKNRKSSLYADWFFLRFDQNNGYGDALSYENWEGHDSLVKLNLQNQSLRDHLFGAVRQWMHQWGIKGLRLDVGYSLLPAFVRELKAICTAIDPDFFIVGEAIHGDYRPFLLDMNSVTNYECYKGLFSSFNDRNFFEIAFSLNRLFGEHGLYQGQRLLNFVDNHDVDRIASTLHEARHLYPLYLLLFTMPGTPSIYYGGEWGIEGKKGMHDDHALRPIVDIEAISATVQGSPQYAFIKKLIALRQRFDVLSTGDYRQLFVASEQFGFIRQTGTSVVIILLNMADHPVQESLSARGLSGTYLDVLNNDESIEANQPFTLYPSWGKILVLSCS